LSCRRKNDICDFEFRISNFEFFACDDIRRNGGSAEGLRRGRAVAVAHAIPDEPT
jgi:hypothetical protein